MTGQQLLDRVAELLGFRVTERENDALLVREKVSGTSVSAVRPATREELEMFIRIIGLVARLEDCATEGNSLRDGNSKLHARLSEASREIDAVVAKLKRAERDAASDADNFQDRMSAALREIEALNKKVSVLESQNQGLDTALAAVMQQRDAASLESTTARLRNKELNEKLAQAERAAIDIEDGLQGRIGFALVQIDRLNQRISDLNAKLAQLEEMNRNPKKGKGHD